MFDFIINYFFGDTNLTFLNLLLYVFYYFSHNHRV